MPRKSRVADVLARNEKGALAMEQNCPLKCVYHIDNPSGIGGEWSLSHSIDSALVMVGSEFRIASDTDVKIRAA